ncbi:hypothetical protein E3J79_02655 [Candidatus Dependentiae bacterium]|nr:MAG: hypothetical protein E3J79_02655 [Candidatus Dependentiae bacterium]
MIRKILIAIVSQYLFFFSLVQSMDPTGVAHNPDGIRETFRHNITGRISPKPPSSLLPPCFLPSPPQTTSTHSQFSFMQQNIDRTSRQSSQARLILQQEAARYLNLKDTAQKLIQNQITQFNQRTASTTDFIKLYSIKVELNQNIASLENRIKNIQREMNHYIHTNHLSHETVNDLLKNPERAAELVTHKKLTSEQASQLFSYDAQLYQENCRLEKECRCLESIEKKITELRKIEIAKFEKEFRTLGLEKQFVEIAWLEIERDKNIPTGIAKWTRELNRDQSRLKQIKTSIFKTKNVKREIRSLEHNIKIWESQKAWEQENLLKTKGKIETAYKIVGEQKQKYSESLAPKGMDELQINNERLSQQLQTKSYVKPGDRQEIIQARKNVLEIQKRIVQEEITIKADTQKQYEEGYRQQLTIVMDRLNSPQNNCATEEIQQARLTAVEKALQEQTQPHELHFQFAPHVQQTLAELNIPVEKYQHIKGDALQIQGAQESIQTINTAVELRENFIGKDETIVTSCEASIHFADAGFDMIMTGHVQEGFACNDFSHGILDYAVQKAGLVGIGIAKGVGKGLIRIVTTPIEMACEGDIVGLTAYFGPAPLRTCYNLYTLVHALVSTLATEERRAHFYNECHQFLELPLEKQAEHVSEFLTVLIGPSKIRKIPALQSGIRSIGKLSSATVREFKNFLKPYYLGIAIRTKVELTELVTFGDRIMSSEFKHKIITWGKANGWTLSDAELAKRAEKCMPFSYACTKAAQEFIKGQKIVSSLQQSNIKELLDKGKKIGDRIETMIDENAKIIFRRDFGKSAHPIKSHGYKVPVDHYNVEIHTKAPYKGWNRYLNLHIIIDKTGRVIDSFTDLYT